MSGRRDCQRERNKEGKEEREAGLLSIVSVEETRIPLLKQTNHAYFLSRKPEQYQQHSH